MLGGREGRGGYVGEKGGWGKGGYVGEKSGGAKGGEGSWVCVWEGRKGRDESEVRGGERDEGEVREEWGEVEENKRGKGVVPLDAAAWLRGGGRGAARLLLLLWRMGFWFGFGGRGGRGGGGAFFGM